MESNKSKEHSDKKTKAEEKTDSDSQSKKENTTRLCRECSGQSPDKSQSDIENNTSDKDKNYSSKKEPRYIIEYDRENCIGAGACTAVSDNWIMSDDGRADFLKREIAEEDLEKELEAAQCCPVNVIHIIDRKTGKRLI